MLNTTRRRGMVALIVTGLLCLSLLAGQAPVSGDPSYAPDTVPAFVPGEILVAFHTGAAALDAPARERVLRAYGATRRESISIGRAADGVVDVVQVPEDQELAVADALNRDPRVRYAEPNYLVRAHLIPNDPLYRDQWALPKINAPSAWDITTGGSSVTVAVIDTGVALQNPEFQGRLTAGFDYANNDKNPDDDNGHGTHVAGIIAAAGNNGLGIAGLAWQTKIMPVKVLDNAGYGNDLDTAKGIKYAVDNGADIINISLGGVQSSTTLYDAVKYAYDRGVLVVASAGNCGDSNYLRNGCTYQDQPVYPGAYHTEVFAVAATASNDATASFSNRGDYVDIAAPGLSILSTYLDNKYAYMNGTSQAAPHVSGLAALLLAFDPTLTAQQIQAHIEASSLDLGPIGKDWDYGAGRIDAYAAVGRVIVLSPPALSPILNTDLDGSYGISWSESPYATRYTLQEADNPQFLSATVRYSGPSTVIAVTGQPAGSWYYRVRSERPDAGNMSEWSNTQQVDVGLDTPYLEPIASDGSDSYSIVWQGVIGASGYHLQESSTTDFNSATTEDAGATLSHTVTDQPGGTWYYRVRAYNGVIVSDWSVIRSVTVRPAPPTLYAIEPAGAPDAYRLSWSSAVGATGYRLQESPDPPTIRYLGPDTAYTVTGQPSGHWSYRVEAYNSAGSSLPSNVQEITVTVPSVPAPTLLPIDNDDGDTAYLVEWSAVTTATYLLEECASPYFEAPTLVYSATLTQHTVLDQRVGTWHYRVRAVTEAGAGPWSNTEAVLVPVYAFLPIILQSSSGTQTSAVSLGR